MLFFGGYCEVTKEWKVDEKSASVFLRVYYVEKGDVTYISQTENYKLKEGMLYCFPNNVCYKITQKKTNCLKCLFLHIDISPFIISSLCEISVPKNSLLKNLVNALIESYKIKDNKIISLREKMSDCIEEYLKYTNKFETVDKRLNTSIIYMINHLNEKITLKKISDLSGYHSQYYIRLFSHYMGITPHQFLMQYRMKRAIWLLKSGNSIENTALSVGYSESKNFSRAFKTIYGVSPSQVNLIYTY